MKAISVPALLGRIGKRQRFIISTVLATLCFISASFNSFSHIPFVLPILMVLLYGLIWGAILDGIHRQEWFVLFIVPLYFTVSLFLFYYFLPQRWLSRLPLAMIYSISFYALLLCQNIFNVGVEKSLQLFRAAFAVNYLYATITLFLISSSILSFGLPFYTNGVLLFLCTFPLALQFLWSVNPEERLERRLLYMACGIAILVGEVGWFLSFIPVNSSIVALVATGIFYSISGLSQAYLLDRLFQQKTREYVFVLIFVFVLFLLSIRW